MSILWGNLWGISEKSQQSLVYFGELAETEGIRTLDTALRPYNGLANRRLQPLGHVSGGGNQALPGDGSKHKTGIADGLPTARRHHCSRAVPSPEPQLKLGSDRLLAVEHVVVGLAVEALVDCLSNNAGEIVRGERVQVFACQKARLCGAEEGSASNIAKLPVLQVAQCY